MTFKLNRKSDAVRLKVILKIGLLVFVRNVKYYTSVVLEILIYQV